MDQPARRRPRPAEYPKSGKYGRRVTRPLCRALPAAVDPMQPLEVVIEQGTGSIPQGRPGKGCPATTGIGSVPQQRGYPDLAK